MKAAIMLGPDQTPIFGDFDDPTPEDGFTIVEVAASALSNATRARASGSHYSSAGNFPLVPGIDGVGQTASGQRVGFLLPEAPFGGMAQKTLVRNALCVPIPDDVGDVTSSSTTYPAHPPKPSSPRPLAATSPQPTSATSSPALRRVQRPPYRPARWGPPPLSSWAAG